MPNFIADVQQIRDRAVKNLEEGAVTNAYGLDAERTVDILNDALATEIVCVLRYLHHYFMATGVHAQAVRDEFKEHADAEREHADEIAERIQQLGGKPDFNPRTLLERSVSQYIEGETLGDMIREDLIAERIVIDVYNQMIRYLGDKDPTTRVMLEHILAEEEEHASDLSDLLYIVEPSTGKTEGVDPGVHPLQMHGGSQQDKSRAVAQQQSSRKQGEAAARPAASGKQEVRNLKAERDSSKSGRGQRNEQTTSADQSDEGGMGGGTRAVRVPNKQRKNRAA
jgi:bacterioferritin